MAKKISENKKTVSAKKAAVPSVKKTGKQTTAARTAAQKSSSARAATATKKSATTAAATVKRTASKSGTDWTALPFSYVKTDKRYVAIYKDGSWAKGKLTVDDVVTLSESAAVLQYAQTCFEGLKAYTMVDGHIATFRPDLNAERMITTCNRLEMPAYPKADFIQAVTDVVKANKKFVPPYGSGASLYIRPCMFGTNAVIGVQPADEYQFRIFVTPVGPYFHGGVHPIVIRLSDVDRAAPHGTGDIKAGLNYAMSLHNIVDAHKNGFAENLYLDPATHTYIEEAGGANIIFITKDGTLVTPKSTSILPSITRRSIVQIAKDKLRMKVEERPVHKNELTSFVECGLCGTAAVISPVSIIMDHGKRIAFAHNQTEMGPVLQKLYDTLTGIQLGHIAAPAGWIHTIVSR
ncbi:MAG: branched-chain amino acid aminotransferase [Treponema sp.]|nr:branched-chain amino acid aminotransferase [Treponema sp.]